MSKSTIPYHGAPKISPCNINAYSTHDVMRIKELSSPKVNSLDISMTSPQFFNKKRLGQDRRICSLMLGLNYGLL